MKRKPTPLETLIESLLVQSIGVGMVWLYAWICNPNIDSGMVMLLGLIYGGICASINTAVHRLGGE